MWPFHRKLGPSGFSSSSTAEEVTQGIDGTGLTAIVTGASSGIGTETARVLALRGVHVIMGVRNLAAGEDVKKAIVKEIPGAKVDAMELDLSSMASIRKFASDFNSFHLPLNILINNAGVLATQFMLSKDNIELQFATNHLGHFLLTNLLLDTMKRTSCESSKEGRIVNVSSVAHRASYREGIRFDQINDKSRYSGWSVSGYRQSKLANVLHANELARRLKEDGVDISANSLHPGVIITNIIRHNNIANSLFHWLGRFVHKNVQQIWEGGGSANVSDNNSGGDSRNFGGGERESVRARRRLMMLGGTYPYKRYEGAATTCYVALHSQVKGVSGEFFSDNNLSEASSHGRDIELAKKLWDFSMHLIR